MFNNITIQTQQQGRRVPGLAPGEMYKRYTFGISPLHSGVVSGFCEDILNGLVPAVWAGLKNKSWRTVRKETREVRNKMVVVRMNEDEFSRLQNLFKKTTCRRLSDYLRKLSLQQPVTVKYRNQTADEFLPEMIKLKNELNAIGNNFNQAVHKLHILEKIPEFRSWIIQNETAKQILFNKVNEIKERMNQMYQQWSQK